MCAQHNSSSTVEKAFAILELVHASDDKGVSLGEVARELDVSKSTSYRYLVTLEELNVVRRDANERFHIGVKLVELGSSFLANSDLRSIAMPYLETLSQETQETIHLAVPSDDYIIYIARIDGPHSVRVMTRIGTRATMHSTAIGKCILAHLEPEKVAEILSSELQQRTPRTVTEMQELEQQLAKIRENKYAIDEEEYELGVHCVGSPIFSGDGSVLGALSVAGPSSRLSSEKLIELAPRVRDIAREISQRMSYRL